MTDPDAPKPGEDPAAPAAAPDAATGQGSGQGGETPQRLGTEPSATANASASASVAPTDAATPTSAPAPVEAGATPARSDAATVSPASEPARGAESSAAAGEGALSASPYALARQWADEGVEPATIVSRLVSHGTSEEDAKLLLHSLKGDEHAQAPELTLEPTINPLAPARFSMGELGFSGPRHLVGLYWLTFGGLSVALMGLLQVLWEAELFEPPSVTAVMLSRLAMAGGAVALLYGLALVAATVRVRRK